MNMEWVVFISTLCLGFRIISCESITFDTQVTLTVVDPSLLGNDEAKHSDPENTGSYLFKANGASDTRALTLNILIRDFKSPSSLYFRAHPTFLKCIQKAMSNLRNNDKKVVVVKGFQTSDDAPGSSTKELYHRSGAGIELKFATGVTGTQDELIIAVLKTCPVPMMKLGRDIGIEKLSDSVHFHMKGINHTGGPDITALAGARDYISEGLDPQQIPDCSNISPVSSGSSFPAGMQPESVVGTVDEAIDRSMSVDFSRMVQYLGSSNHISIPGCTIFTGNANADRCGERTMTTRMYNVVKYVQKMVRDNMSGTKLKVTKAWDNSDPASLHAEGRAITVELAPSGSLSTLAQYAVCAGVDYVKHEGSHLFLAVKKMKGDIANMIQFKNIQLMGVEPPASKASYYSLPSGFKQSEIDAKYALFDSSEREDIKLGDNATIGMFKSRDIEYRYFRLDPRLVNCYSAIVYNENKNVEEDIDVEVIRGYISNPEQAAIMDILDNRYDTHTLGVAMQIRYRNGTGSDYTTHRLAQKAVELCSPIFNYSTSDSEAVGVGIYKDSVFVDIRDMFELWVEKSDYIPKAFASLEAYQDYMEERAQLANKYRIVDPDDMTEACNLAHPPRKQSLTYHYEEPEISKRKKRRRRRSTGNECIPTSSTDHCNLVAKHLLEEVTEIWRESNRKHIYRNNTEVKEALDNCLGICGTCLEGAIYEEKLKHCNNLLHWLPFEMMNDDKDVTAFYPRDNLQLRQYACNGGHHCLEKAPLFSILMPSVKRLYRPDPTKSVQEMIYSSEENPTPIVQILDEIYAINAKGRVNFFVAGEADIVSMKKALQTAMLYNKDVTNVHIYVSEAQSKEPVSGIVEGYIKEFATTGCPKYTRETVADFEVHDIPHSVKKRAAHRKHNEKNELIRRQMDWETLSVRGP